MEDDKITKSEQKRVDACQNVIKWASEDKKHRGCIVIATDKQSSTFAMIGESKNIIVALISAIQSTPNLRNILSAALMFDTAIGGSKSDTDKDKDK